MAEEENKINWFYRALDFIELYTSDNAEEKIFSLLIRIIGQEEFNQLIENTKDQVTDNLEDYSFTAFHKNFRQTDVAIDPKVDMIMWNFIHISKVPQRVYYGIQNKTYDGEPCDPGFEYFDEFMEEYLLKKKRIF